MEKSIEFKNHLHRYCLFISSCNDEKSAEYLKTLIKEFDNDGQKFRGWLKTEFGDRDFFTGNLEGEYWQDENPEETMIYISKKNGFDFNNLLVREYAANSTGVSVTFESTDQNVTKKIRRMIEKANGLKVGICKLRLVHKKVQQSGYQNELES